MRMSEESNVVATVLENLSCLKAHCAFSVRPRYMNAFEFMVRISKVLRECSHVVDVRFFSWLEFSVELMIKDPLETLVIFS